MTHLQKIVAQAKKIRKAHPGKKWTDCIKQASKAVPKTKSKAVGKVKKTTSKKAAPKAKKSVPVKSYKRAANVVPAHSRRISGVDMAVEVYHLQQKLKSEGEKLKKAGTKAMKAMHRRAMTETRRKIKALNSYLNTK